MRHGVMLAIALGLICATSLFADDLNTTNAGLQPGQTVLCKADFKWYSVKVMRLSGQWTFVFYADRPARYEWVEPWRLRPVGMNQGDALGMIMPRYTFDMNAPPPVLQPSPPPNPNAMPGAAPLPLQVGNTTASPSGAISEPDRGAMATLVPDRVNLPMAPDAPLPPQLNFQPFKFTGNPMESMCDFLTSFGPYAGVVYRARADINPALYVESLDLHKGSAAGPLMLERNLAALAFSPDGKYLLTRSNAPGNGVNWRLDIWAIAPPAPKALYSFRPYVQVKDSTDTDILWAKFIDDTHFVTCCNSHVVDLWQLAGNNVRGVYSIAGDNNVIPTLTAGGKYLLVGANNSTCVCDALTGSCAAIVPHDEILPGAGMALRPDGKRLAAFEQRRLLVWDTASGHLLTDVGIPGQFGDGPVQWAGDNLVLLNNVWLYDVSKMQLIWKYTTPGLGDSIHWWGGRLWFLSFGDGLNEGYVCSAELPDMQAIQQAAAAQPANLLVKPGSTVSLILNLAVDDAKKKQIADYLVQLLRKNGVTVAEGQPVALVASSSPGDDVDVSFSTDKDPTADIHETVNACNFYLQFELNDQVVWGMDGVAYIPTYESIRSSWDAGAVANQLFIDSFDWFLDEGLPEVITAPQAHLFIGASDIRRDGIYPSKIHPN